MRKINLIFIFLGLFILSIIVFNNIELDEEIIPIFYVIFFMAIGGMLELETFKEQPFGYAFWINPILQLSIMLIKLDGVEKISETKRIIKYLNNEFDPVTVKFKLRFYKKQLKIEQNIQAACETIKETNTTKDKVRLMQHLIRLALTDRLLADQEKVFLEKVTKKIGLPKSTLNAILQLHIYVTEEDIRNQKINKSYVNFSQQRAFSILGLDTNAKMEEVKEAYRSLVMIYHPDKLQKSERNKEQAKTKFQAITDAYQFLKNELN
jgi:DnaJ-domain-containing protein 1